MSEKSNLKQNILQSVLVVCIIVLSFRFYSSNYYPALNSDDAVNILMTHHLELPQDLYFWGQDRAGSIIPFVGNFIHHSLGFSAVTATSLANYLFLVIGYIGFSSLFGSRLSKIIFALIWFLPVSRFIDLTRMQIGVQYSIIALVILFINRINLTASKKLSPGQHFLLAGIAFLFVLDSWVSDISVLSFATMAAVLWLFHFINNRRLFFHIEIFIYALLGMIGGYLFVRYAKSSADQEIIAYMQRNSFTELVQAIKLIKSHLGNIAKFKVSEPLLSIWAYCSFLIFCILTYLLFFKKISLTKKQKIWALFFFADSCIMFAAILFSKWTLLNGMGRRYFVGNYITISILVIILLESTNLSSLKSTLLKAFLLITVLIGSVSTFYSLKKIFPKTFKPKMEFVAEFKQLGKTGIIAEYWNSYISACADPDNIKATPHDKDHVRNPALALEVFNQPRIYLIKDMWLQEFPDTITEFGHQLIRKGNPFHLGDCTLCEYRK